MAEYEEKEVKLEVKVEDESDEPRRQRLAAPVAPVPYWTYLIPVLVAFISAAQIVLLAWIGSNAKTALENSEKTKVAAVETATSVEKIHVAVNSEREKAMKKIESLEQIILKMSTDKATADERRRKP